MTTIELYTSIKDRIKFIQFPKSKIHPFTKVGELPDFSDDVFYYTDYGYYVKNITRLPVGENYYGWLCNHHHFTTSYHINTVIPLLNDIFDFGYNINDFDFIHRVVNGFDISMPVPKNKMTFDVISYTDNEILRNVRYKDFLYCGDGKFMQQTEYHKIYRYGHKCSKIVNKSVSNERVLLISGDSQMIPSVPILSTYFSEVMFFDNRDGKNHFYENVGKITDILFAIGYNDFNKYINNLK